MEALDFVCTCVRLEVLMAVKMSMLLFWVVMPSSALKMYMV
jgi:hypothetical protein